MKNHALNLTILALLLILTLWAYWGVRLDPFHFDDALFLQSPQVTSPGVPWYLLKPSQSRQLTYLSFYLNYRLGGTHPQGYHVFNLVLHCMNAIGVYIFTLLLCQLKAGAEVAAVRRWLPLAAAGIFSLHPIQSEAVNYIYQRSSLLAAFFSLAALVAFLLSLRAKQSSAITRALVAGFAILAALSKETALVLPLMMVAMAWVYTAEVGEHRQAFRQSRPLLVALTLLMFSGAAWALFNLHQKGERTVGLNLMRESSGYLVGQAQVLAAYVRLLLWPDGLVIDHAFRPAPPLSSYSLLCWLFLMGLVVLCIRNRRANPNASFWGLAFLILLSPSSSIIPSTDLMFEHRLYLPMIAGSALIGWLLFRTCRLVIRHDRASEITSLVLMTAVLISLTCVAKQRTYVWGDNLRLWTDAATKVPDNARAHYNLGVAYLNLDRQKAYREFQQTAALQPKHAAALYNLGWLEQTGGRLDVARSYYQAATLADADYWQAHQNLANLDILTGRIDDAIREFRTTIRLRADQWPAYQSLAAIQIQSGDSAGALATLQNLIKMQPDLLEARFLRAYALVKEKRADEATAEIRFILSRDRQGDYAQRIRELEAYLDSSSSSNHPKP